MSDLQWYETIEDETDETDDEYDQSILEQMQNTEISDE